MSSPIKKIQELRALTGAGMMDCKRALEANDYDVDRAKDWLREQGITTAAKKSGRIAAEGLTVAKIVDGNGVIVEVNCETDFVSRGKDFPALVDEIVDLLLKNKPVTKEDADALVNPLLVEATVKIGEKLSFRRFELFEVSDRAAAYIHMGGTIATLVLLEKKDDELAKGLAMHVAANAPSYITKNDIRQDELDKEKHIQMELAKNDPKLADKPAAMLEKILAGKINKHFSDLVLVDQTYLIDGDKKVSVVLSESSNKVLRFVRYQVGEGIERRKDDFASEVLEQIK